MKTKLVHVTLDPERIARIIRKAKRNGISFDRVVGEAITEFLC